MSGLPHPRGLVSWVFVKVGDAVREGDSLFQLDAREAASRVETVQAQLEAMRATLKAEEVALADTEGPVGPV